MGNPRRDDHDVPGPDLGRHSLRAPESDPGHPSVDPQHLMGRAVIMVKSKNAVAPGVNPRVRAESILEDGGRIIPGRSHGLRVDQQGPAGIVGERAIGRQPDLFYGCGHGPPGLWAS